MLTKNATIRFIVIAFCAWLVISACQTSTQILPTATSILATAPSILATAPSILATDTTASTDIPTVVPSATAQAPSDTPTPVPQRGAAMIASNGEAVNCRFGPGKEWLSVGALGVGKSVPVFGTNQDKSWWQIDSSWNPGTRCWVSGTATTLSGDYQSLPVLPVPQALVTDAQITTPATVHGFCGGPNATYFTGTITTNGPVTVVWHWEIYDTATNTQLNVNANVNLVFTGAGTQTFTSDAYKRDCGSYLTKLVVTSPNSMTAKANWSVVQP